MRSLRPRLWIVFVCGLAHFIALAEEGGSKPDFGDHSSATLTSKAWAASGQKNHDHAITYAEKCREMYMEQALQQQGGLQAPAPKETAHDYWALNDVGTCLFILGQTYEAMGKNDKALGAYQTLVEKLPFSQCWDPKGWFWKPADAAKQKLVALKFKVEQEKPATP
jgi:tetratricopeptide (TPR) repeat protein